MKTKFCICSQFNYLTPRTAIGALHAVRQSRTSSQILFAVCLIKKQALTGGTSLACEDKCSKKIGAVLVQQADRRSFEAECTVPILVYLYIIMINKYRQSAKRRLLLSNPTDRTFGNRHVGCKEREKINRRRTLCTLRINFFEATPQTACIFSKEILPVKSSLNPYRTYLV